VSIGRTPLILALPGPADPHAMMSPTGKIDLHNRRHPSVELTSDGDRRVWY
jgi:hypothetical protein